MKDRRFRVAFALAALFTFLLGAEALAQTYPTKPVRLIVPYVPGGVLDGLMRPIGQQLSDSLGQPFIVENRPGANTATGTGLCARGTPDGYTICASGNGVFYNPLLYKNLNYSPERDLAPVTNMVFQEGVIVANASMPFSSLRELVSYAKANPGKLNFGSFGEGSAGHLYFEWIKNRTGVDMVHIPYNGAAPVITATLANEVQTCYMGTGAIMPHIKSGRVKPLVVPFATRSKYLPSVPTFTEEGYDFKPSSWFGLFVLTGTPRPIIMRIQSETRKILFNPKFHEQVIVPQFYEAVGNTPEEFTEFLSYQRAVAAELVRISGIKPVDM
jgi:tripartite-type tricarboxylate transporter receptor subunit TctC